MQITAVTVCFDDLMQLGCVQLIISLDYLLNAASRQPSGSWRSEGWAQLIERDTELRAKVAKQNASIFKMFNKLCTQTDSRLEHLFWVSFIMNRMKSGGMHLKSSGLKFNLCGGTHTVNVVLWLCQGILKKKMAQKGLLHVKTKKKMCLQGQDRFKWG